MAALLPARHRLMGRLTHVGAPAMRRNFALWSASCSPLLAATSRAGLSAASPVRQSKIAAFDEADVKNLAAAQRASFSSAFATENASDRVRTDLRRPTRTRVSEAFIGSTPLHRKQSLACYIRWHLGKRWSVICVSSQPPTSLPSSKSEEQS